MYEWEWVIKTYVELKKPWSSYHGLDNNLSWEIHKKASPYQCGSKSCGLHSFLPQKIRMMMMGEGVLVLKFGQRGGSWKNYWDRKLVERGVSKLFYRCSFRKVLITIGILFLSGKYSRLLYPIHLLFHVIYLLLENDILLNFFSSYSYF